MARSSDAVRAERLNAALALLQEPLPLAEAVGELMQRYGMSRRQAYRYLQKARSQNQPIPVPEPKVAFTVKLSPRLIRALRQRAQATEQSLSELVGQALERFLRSEQ